MTDLSTLIQRDQFQRDVLLTSIKKSVFWQSGVIVPDAELSRLMKAGVGSGFDFDYFLDLADTGTNISDDSGTLAGTDGISADTAHAIGNYRNKGWGTRNITASLSTTGDPATAIASRVGAWWARAMDTTVLAIVEGLNLDNVTNDASDMVNDQTGVAVNLDMILDTVQTAGDSQDQLGVMICHSAIVTSLKKQSLTDRIYDVNSGAFLYEAIAGRRLIMNDDVPTNAGNYTSYIISQGLIGFGEGSPKLPNEIERTAASGNGAGSEIYFSRKEFCLHPYGFTSTVAPASTSPTDAEFAALGAWDRKVERKRIGMATLISLA